MPTANDDVAGISEGDADNAVTFDVDTNDGAGADGTASRVFTSLTGTYGTITLNAGDGTQTYTLSAAGIAAIDALAPGAILTDTFSYTLTDGDNDTDPAQLVVTLTGTDDPPLITQLTPKADGGDVSVDEDDLADGSDTAKESLTQTGTFTIAAADGIDDLTVGGHTVILDGVFTADSWTTPLGNTIAITGYNAATGEIAYSYTLADNETHADAAGENVLFEDFAVSLTDSDGDAASDTLSVRIVDDVPTANDDVDAIAAGGSSAAGNVITGLGTTNAPASADVTGADGATITGLVSVNLPANSDTNPTGGFVVVGQFGTLTMQADGSYTYLRSGSGAVSASDTFTYTLTDGDGDAATATLTISLADAIPLTGLNGTVLLDDDALTGGIAGGVDDDINAANLTGTLAGSGGDGALTWAITGMTAPVGFSLTTVNPGLYEIRQGTTLVLTVTLNTTNGDYTVTQNAPILHPAGADENNVGFTLAYQVTDADGDQAAGTLAINVDDDTPTAVVSAAVQPVLVVDDTSLGTNATASFASLFTLAFGADGAAAGGGIAYALGVVAGASGIFDVASGEAVNLSLTAGGAVEGRTATGGLLVFSLTVAANGDVTLDQVRAVQHNDPLDPNELAASAATLSADNLVTLTATVTDKDGDAATASVNIGQNLQFQDDGPSLVAAVTQPVLVVDDTTLLTNAAASFAGVFTANFGADGAGTVSNYQLGISAANVNSGIIDVATGQAVNLTLTAGGVVEGRTASSNLLVFTVSVDATGLVTLDQIRAVQHNDPLDPNEVGASAATLSADNLITLSATVTDKDGDTATAVANIGQNLQFQDDGPTAAAPLSLTMANAIGTNGTAFLDADHDVDNNYGADGAGKMLFTAATITSLQGQNLTAGFATLNYAISLDGTVLTATKSTDSSQVFTISLQPLGSPDQYVVHLDQKLDTTATIDFNAGGYNFVGGNNSWSGFIPVGEVVGSPIDNNSQDLLLTPSINGLSNSTINATANSGGIGSGASVGATETFRVDFVTDLRGNPADGAGNYDTSANRDHLFDGHYTVNGASALFKSSTGSTVKITAFDDTDGNTVVGDGAKDTINGLTIAYLGVLSSLITASGAYLVNGQNFTVGFNADGSVNVANVAGASGSSLAGTVIAVFTASGYNSVEYSWQAGDTFQIGDFGATTLTNAPKAFTVPVSIQDGDSDTLPSGNLAITLSAVPVVLDLNHDGVSFLARSDGVSFDYLGDGTPLSTAWAGKDDGILAIDLNGNGKVDSGSEIVFGGNGLTDLEGIAATYDSNHDGLLDAQDADFAKFGVWQDANSDGVNDAGEFRSLDEMGIASIDLTSDGESYTAANGDVTVHGETTYTLTDGSTGTAADASFAVSAGDVSGTPDGELMSALLSLGTGDTDAGAAGFQTTADLPAVLEAIGDGAASNFVDALVASLAGDASGGEAAAAPDGAALASWLNAQIGPDAFGIIPIDMNDFAAHAEAMAAATVAA